MKIGIWLRYGYSPSVGGGFSYFDALITKLQTYKFCDEVEWCFVSPGSKSEDAQTVSLGLIPDKYWPFNILAKNNKIAKFFFFINSKLLKQRCLKTLRSKGIGIIYYPNQDDTILRDFPFIATLWDMGYFQTFPFPELTIGNNFRGRYELITKTMQKALMVFSESEAGRQELERYANINPVKVRVVPIFASNVINMNTEKTLQTEILTQFKLSKNKFFFYPAQFWAHKNHICVVRAFAEFVKVNPEYKLVFTGGNKGTMPYIKKVCEDLQLSNSVLFLGYVSRDALYTFYKNATSLIMASYFGPTNMPPIEALSLGCPVICSDISGHREIMEDAALYFKPQDSVALLKCMRIVNGAERESFLKKIKDRAELSKFNIDNALMCMDKYFKEALIIRDNWE